MKRSQCLGTVCIALFILSATASAAGFIVKDGAPLAEIIIAENPARMVQLAASELQTYI